MDNYNYYLDTDIDRKYFISDILEQSQGKKIVVVGIGTDKHIGDSFGPFVGTVLTEMDLENIIVYGTLKEPIHAQNVNKIGKEIMNKHKDDFVIAIDACISKEKLTNKLIYKKDPVKPGAGVGKELCEVGHVSINFGLGESSFLEFMGSSNYRINDIYEGAKRFGSIIKEIDNLITNEKEIIDEVSIDLHGQE